jgi:indolepyruvate ferredoxin oxidoreductase beta subunit
MGRDGVVNVVIAGLGGQGVLTASDILADAAFRAGCDVKKAEVHGMSQRGGSVSTDVRFGPRVLSPMVPPGEADFLVVLEETQVAVAQSVLRSEGTPIGPDAVDGARLPNSRSLNVALMGVLSAHLDLAEDCWIEALRANIKAKYLDANLEAFRLGRATAKAPR